jgi:hypothetical protein
MTSTSYMRCWLICDRFRHLFRSFHGKVVVGRDLGYIRDSSREPREPALTLKMSSESWTFIYEVMVR